MTLKQISIRLYKIHTLTAIVCVFSYGAINVLIASVQNLNVTSILLLVILSVITLLAIVGIGTKESDDKN